ncbi:unnamed protein product [Psylliodes chrysocephalus]|uniref:DUF7083 domain-containing protein n=1 Tax=Psylliodes chrysocephalus TaxID=3402493 RepID=A0A9P0CCU0_9CUCU|nr:unnamed protein product [Psylliodes chrysocephala]
MQMKNILTEEKKSKTADTDCIDAPAKASNIVNTACVDVTAERSKTADTEFVDAPAEASKIAKNHSNSEQMCKTETTDKQRKKIDNVVSGPSSTMDNIELIIESLARNLMGFVPNLDKNVTFYSWFRRYEDLFLIDGAKLNDAAKSSVTA